MIRSAGKEDASAVYKMVCLLEESELEKEPFMDIYFRQLEAPMYSCLVHEENGEILGVLNMRIEGQLHHAAKIAEITELFVLADVRSGGIGSQLLNTAVEMAGDAGCVRIELSSNMRRTDAHRFYEKNGFHKTHFNLTYDIVKKAQ